MVKMGNSAGGNTTNLFTEEVPFEMSLTGKVNGNPFTIQGKGMGHAGKGSINGKWTCTSGKMPLAWPALASTLAYGFKCFANYPTGPDGIAQFFQDCMPEGYTQERTIKYENDGTLEVYHEVSYHEGIMRNIVKLDGVGFKPDGPLMNDGIKTMLNSTEKIVPHGKGLKCASVQFFPLKKGVGHVFAEQITLHRPLAKGRTIPIPAPHFNRVQQKQMVDPNDKSDHFVQHEIIQGHDFNYQVID